MVVSVATNRYAAVSNVDEFSALLSELTGIKSSLTSSVQSAVRLLFQRALPTVEAGMEAQFFGNLNQKLDANRTTRAESYRLLAGEGITLNYPQKKRFARALDEGDLDRAASELRDAGVGDDLVARVLDDIDCVAFDETRRLLQIETVRPSKLRKALLRDVESDVFNSAAGSLVWAIWPRQMLYNSFGGRGEVDSARDYLQVLEEDVPALFARDRTLAVRLWTPSQDRVSERERLTAWVSAEYEGLANHGFLVLVVDAQDSAAAWRLINDATVYAERHRLEPLRQMFFRSAEIAKETVSYAPGISEEGARFELLSEGFTYRDVFVSTDASGGVQRLILVMQKNARDETRIPCPACRGRDVEGNSYPSLGVRSWECRNPLCPSRSIYNRGNRFQFRSVVQQAAIEDPGNAIPPSNVNRWRKDVVPFVGDHEIINTMIRHYSIVGDGVAVIGASRETQIDGSGRRVTHEELLGDPDIRFWQGPFFQRFEADIPADATAGTYEIDSGVVHGDSTAILGAMPESSVDRAVTSPPYYNAREYAQWPNLYCYLRDMRENARAVFRVLRPGGLYVFNIFDHFDNERTVTFSDMGRKRIPLGALISLTFERIGFDLVGVVPWDKGDIHGKRGFNGGNYSPYYQSPFNCWEHILVLRKPGADLDDVPPGVVGRTLRLAPVFKMVRGENRFGHTAPFPDALPETFLEGLEEGSVVLDPYAGSGSTGCAALRLALRPMMVERDMDYARLARKRLSGVQADLASALF